MKSRLLAVTVMSVEALAGPELCTLPALQDGMRLPGVLLVMGSNQQYTLTRARLISVALGNLLSNAWKYNVKVERACIEFGEFIKGTQRVYYVKDNGEGKVTTFNKELLW